jgi:hypothetical protein
LQQVSLLLLLLSSVSGDRAFLLLEGLFFLMRRTQ